MLQLTDFLDALEIRIRKVAQIMPNIQLKPVALQAPSDVPAPGSFANGSAILLQTPLPQSRRLTGCYVSKQKSCITTLEII